MSVFPAGLADRSICLENLIWRTGKNPHFEKKREGLMLRVFLLIIGRIFHYSFIGLNYTYIIAFM